jgi:hypothetical protein
MPPCRAWRGLARFFWHATAPWATWAMDGQAKRRRQREGEARRQGDGSALFLAGIRAVCGEGGKHCDQLGPVEFSGEASAIWSVSSQPPPRAL